MMDGSMTDREEKEFRFSSKREYEEKLERLVQQQLLRFSNPKRPIPDVEAEYEDLLEEYLRFCNEHG